MHRVLIADPLEASGIELLREGGVEAVVLAAADRPRLGEMVGEFDALVVRSATKVTRALLASPGRLRVIGRAGVGVDNVDVDAATERGILVVNAPTANLTSATEHTLALMLALARRLPAADASMKRGEWDRKSFVGIELQGKTLGVVGFGRIGQRVAARARGLEMTVVAFDPFLDPALASRLGVEMLPLDALLAAADVVTLHTPLTRETHHLVDAARLARMKPGALLVNCGRGGVVDETALLAALESGRLGGAALDVFEAEPPASLDLVRHPRVVATPHIGAQTGEAQERIAIETAHTVLAALAGEMPSAAVNLPFVPTGSRAQPLLRLGERLGGLAATLAGAPLARLEVELAGGGEDDLVPVAIAALKGALELDATQPINYVNAEWVAAERGVVVTRSQSAPSADYPQLVRVRAGGGEREVDLAGALFGAGELRVVDFLGYRLEFAPYGRLLVLENRDVPGVVGRIGTLLGAAGVNIADIHLARVRATGEAMAVLRLDQAPDATTIARLRELPEIDSVWTLDLAGNDA
ncbi:MAG TPA: phosphoglycerate dehydrogenase [Thermoanaerobaculia bacterium]|nr:phosphoglycerate dehydrogenase [Thermoanaerobaculia bacterium]